MILKLVIFITVPCHQICTHSCQEVHTRHLKCTGWEALRGTENLNSLSAWLPTLLFAVYMITLLVSKKEVRGAGKEEGWMEWNRQQKASCFHSVYGVTGEVQGSVKLHFHLQNSFKSSSSMSTLFQDDGCWIYLCVCVGGGVLRHKPGTRLKTGFLVFARSHTHILLSINPWLPHQNQLVN